MNIAIANSIRDDLKSLEWIETISGLVRAYNTTERVVIENRPMIIRKSLPVSCDISHETCHNRYNFDLMPDAKKRSIIYFEDGGVQFQGSDGRHRHWQSSLTLVCWVNMEKFEFSGCSISPLLIGSIMENIDTKLFNLPDDGIVGVQLNVIGESPKSAAIFSKWSYREEQDQYLLYPYDYFALNIQSNFRTAGSGCANEIIIKSNADCPR